MGVLDTFKSARATDKNTKNIFANRLSMLLDVFKIQKKELANVLDINPVAITKYTSGITMPSVAVLLGIAKYFNVTTDYLLGQSSYPILPEDYVYFNPIGSVQYDYVLQDGSRLTGKLDYIFGLTIWNMELPKDNPSLNQFLCFKFSKYDQGLYDALFLDDKLHVGYFLYTMQSNLGLPIMSNINGGAQLDSFYFANLLIWNEDGIKPPRDVYSPGTLIPMVSMQNPRADSTIRLSYSGVCLAKPHVDSWLALTDQERATLLMERLRNYKNR